MSKAQNQSEDQRVKGPFEINQSITFILATILVQLEDLSYISAGYLKGDILLPNNQSKKAKLQVRYFPFTFTIFYIIMQIENDICTKYNIELVRGEVYIGYIRIALNNPQTDLDGITKVFRYYI